jgi:hypothetical protein
MSNMYKLFSIFCLFTIISCQQNINDNKTTTSPLFSLKGFLDAEINNTLMHHTRVRKTVTINDKVEIKELDIQNWNAELKPFFNADINKPAWYDKYQISEKRLADSSLEKTYQTKEKHLKTKQLSVIQNDNTQNVKLTIFTSDKTAVTQSDAQLIYDTHAGYQISTQQMLLGTTEKVVIKVEFLK